MEKKLILDDTVRTIGKRTDGYINFGQKPDGSQFRIPVIVIEGDKDGPTLLVDACTHGDEYEGAEAIIQMADKLQTETFAGTFIGVPALNFEAFSCISRVSLSDGFNLNRIFPGNKETYITHRLAYIYMERVVEYADFVITFHGGGDVLHLEPIIGYLPGDDEISRKTLELAKAFNQKFIWRMQNLPFNGVSSIEYKNILGIPSILPEVGSHCGRLYDREKNVKICYDGITNVMLALKMLDGELPVPVEKMHVELHYLHSRNGGIQRLVKKKGEIVEEGEILGEIYDVFGNKIEELKAPYRGVVIGFWSVPVIRPGDWWYLYAKILD